MTIPVVTRAWPYNPGPITQIQPFTYEDGITYVEILYALKNYITGKLLPYISEVTGEVDERIVALVAAVDKALEDQNEEFQEVVQQIINNSIEIQDPLAAQLVEDPTSFTGTAIRELIPALIGDPEDATAIAINLLVDNVFAAKREALNLRDFGAKGNGVTDDTAAVKAWATAVQNSNPKIPGIVPGGDYLVRDTIKAVISGGAILGSTQRTARFFTDVALTRVLDFRESGASIFSNITVDGGNVAQTAFDLSNVNLGASTRNLVDSVRILNTVDRGYDMTNNGDTVMRDCSAGPVLDSSTICYWPNMGGNTYIQNPTWFNKPGNVPVTGGGRAAFEGSFQNAKFEGGALMGIMILDGQTSQALAINGVQMYPYKDNANISGPKTAGALLMLSIEGATKLATHTPSHCYFGGRFGYAINVDNAIFNSAADNTAPVAFGTDFVAGAAGPPTTLAVVGGVVRTETGKIAATWNDQIANLQRDYSGFQIGGTKRNVRDVIDIGTGVAGTGPQIGGGLRLRVVNSVVVTLDFPNVAAGGNAALSAVFTGVEPANLVEARASAPLPLGCHLQCEVTGANSVRVTLFNGSGAPQDLTSMGVRLYVIAF